MHARVVIACGALLFSGCSLILAGELDEAHETVVLPDSGEAGGGDGGGIDAAKSDGNVEASAPKGCAAYQPAPKFCADFDGDAGLEGWGTSVESGAIIVSSEQPFSAPSAAKVTVVDKKDGCFYTRLDRDFDVGSKRVSVAVRLRLESPWPDAMIPLAIELTPGGGDQYCTAIFFINAPNGKPESVNLDVQSRAQDNHMFELKGYPSTGEWAEMRVTVTPRAGGGSTYETVFMDPDGFTVSNSQDFPECPAWSRMGLHLGAHCDHRDATMSFDDVRVDWE